MKNSFGFMIGFGLLLWGSPAFASYTLVAHTSAASADQAVVTTSAIDTTGANLLVIALGHYPGGTNCAISDSKGNSWTALTPKASAGGHNRALLYYSVPTSVGPGHTFTCGSPGNFDFPSIAVMAWSGAAASPFDKENGATASSGMTIQPGSITPSENNELVISASSETSDNSSSVDSSFTITDQEDAIDSVQTGLAMAYKVQSIASAENPTWTFMAALGEADAVIASFKARRRPAARRRAR